MSKPAAIDTALCHGWIDGQLVKCDETSSLTRFTSRNRRSKRLEVNSTRALELIAAGRMTRASMAEVEAACSDGCWEAAYPLASTATVPAGLQAALEAAPAVAAFSSR